jgi:hypothetical protein
VLAWLAEHPRWTFHFTPTSCSWLNAVEGFFSKLTRQSLKRGAPRYKELVGDNIEAVKLLISLNLARRGSICTPISYEITDKLAAMVGCRAEGYRIIPLTAHVGEGASRV